MKKKADKIYKLLRKQEWLELNHDECRRLANLLVENKTEGGTIKLNILSWSYEWDGDLVLVTAEDDRGKRYEGSLEIIEDYDDDYDDID